ncbi:MAG TPA: cob(I)yrinic acid a,c-diamide adenosyltransferase [Chloroflexota bacterium]|nr:cob(I)yrinic acid a,c-diamide adenosyltransferase [Chloroflexota bacterium]
MAKVTTRIGDDGYTGLLGDERVPKYDARIEAMGSLDEASAALGLARSLTNSERVRNTIEDLQRGLYRLMGEVAATPETAGQLGIRITSADVSRLEETQAEFQRDVPIANAFIIPGATSASAAIDLGRTIVRRGEREVARLFHEGAVANQDVLRYLNRLSDLLFVLARFEELQHGTRAPMARQV